MEMHQVRYFLAVARTHNFKRAAEECNVTQPSLTPAIRQLEAEFGGDLFRRTTLFAGRAVARFGCQTAIWGALVVAAIGLLVAALLTIRLETD